MFSRAYAPQLPVCLDGTGATLPQAWMSALRLAGMDIRSLGHAGAGGIALIRDVPMIGRVASFTPTRTGLRTRGAEALRAALGARRLFVNARNRPMAEALETEGFRCVRPARTLYALSLDPCADVLAARLAPTWRGALERAVAGPLTAQRTTRSAATGHRTGLALSRQAGVDPHLLDAIRALDPGALQVFDTGTSSGPRARLVVLRSGRSAFAVDFWASATGRRGGAAELCVWHAMLELGQMGVEEIAVNMRPSRASGRYDALWRGAGAQSRPLGGVWQAGPTAPAPRSAFGRGSLDGTERDVPGLRPATLPSPALPQDV